LYTFVYIKPVPRKYSIADARSNLPTIVDQAEAGVEVELTRHGKPVAVVLSLRQLERLRGDRARFTDAYKAFLKRHSPKTIGFERDFFESLRPKEAGRTFSL
jgi:prevent-host-death family protein